MFAHGTTSKYIKCQQPQASIQNASLLVVAFKNPILTAVPASEQALKSENKLELFINQNALVC